MRLCRNQLAGPIGVKVSFPADSGFLPAVHFRVFDFMHSVYNIVRDLGLQFSRKATEYAHFVNRKHARFFDYVNMMNDGHKGPVVSSEKQDIA
jgi:hypothetical protein